MLPLSDRLLNPMSQDSLLTHKRPQRGYGRHIGQNFIGIFIKKPVAGFHLLVGASFVSVRGFPVDPLRDCARLLRSQFPGCDVFCGVPLRAKLGSSSSSFACETLITTYFSAAVMYYRLMVPSQFATNTD
jgi:hypothetical protein